MPSRRRRLFDTLIGLAIKHTDEFSYTDPVDASVRHNQGFRIVLHAGSRFIWRLAGTGTDGATLRIYCKRFLEKDIELKTEAIIQP